ncbi:hypothetical protein GYH30_018166 [Glycine max]|uniref:Uncharacterized protein n=1 Tax=Glycine max TaxID=3847 RepID=A0A0R0J2B3_SOYBN|nr:hypothetical protein GYH30_018166 [Glycine max]
MNGSTTSKALSRMDLCSTNTSCSKETHLGSKGFNWLANTFDNILYKTFQRDIGRKSFIAEGFSFLRVSTVLVAFS